MKKSFAIFSAFAFFMCFTILSTTQSSYAYAYEANIIVGNRDNNSVDFFEINANGNVTPVKTIRSSGYFDRPLSAYAYNNELYVLNHGGHSIEVFNITDSGDIAPKRRIAGASTGMGYPSGFVFDNGEIYVTNYSGNITVYNASDSGNIAPKRTIQSGNAMSVVVIGEELFVTNYGGGQVLVYNKASGVLLRTISGANTGFTGYVNGLTSRGNELYVSDSANRAIKVFSADASGNAVPKRVIAGEQTNLINNREICIFGDELFVMNQNGTSSTVNVYNISDEGNAAPKRIIAGSNTTFKGGVGPQGITVALLWHTPIIPGITTKLIDYFPKTNQGENGIYLQSRDENGIYYDLSCFSDYTFKTPNAPNKYNIPIIKVMDFTNGIIEADPSAYNQCGAEKDAVIKTVLSGNYGTIRVTGETYVDKGSVRFYIYLGEAGYNAPLWQTENSGTFDLTIQYSDGDSLYFAVDAGPDDVSDWPRWKNIAFETNAPSVQSAGNAASFSQVNSSYISVPDSDSLDLTSALTIEAWIKPDGGGEWALICGKQYSWNDTNPWYAYRFCAASADSSEQGFPRKIMFNISTEYSNEVGVTSDTVVQNNIWTHVAGVYDGSSMKIYINGILEKIVPQTGNISVTALPLYMGKAPWTPYNNYNGQIDEMRIWNVARTADEIYTNMHKRLTGNEIGLVGYWPFDEMEGSVTADLSGNNNDGTLNNEAFFAQSDASIGTNDSNIDYHWKIDNITYSGNVVEVCVSSLAEAVQSYPNIIMGIYNENGKLIKIMRQTIEQNITDYTFDILGVSEIKRIKVFIWEDLNSLKPESKSCDIIYE
ncbi:MAG: Lactonase, 7-bladed beta-propeller [Firmicutes bacterium ADurb.Bin193]|nr:MAG: Lactonase, 7-bladed beta-propeller [Firmicutes bacterium ADurb.Bin193]